MSPLALARRLIGRLSSWIDPLRIAWGKRQLETVFSTPRGMVEPAIFRFESDCAAPQCAAHAEALALESRVCARAGQERYWSALGRPTALVIELKRYRSFEEYRRLVSKRTGGRYGRSANKAARLGYGVRVIDEEAFGASLNRIRTSKVWRSHGLVLEALIGERVKFVDFDIAPREPVCPTHWTRTWGVFGALGDEPDAMVARAVLRRAGNVATFNFFMGQAEVLGQGVTKLLMFAIMKWVLDRADPAASGLDFVLQGVAEKGGRGILDWKRYTLFEPRSLALVDDRPFALPDGFDPGGYLDLNPDVRATGVDPVRHYIFHGLFQGRPYRRMNPR